MDALECQNSSAGCNSTFSDQCPLCYSAIPECPETLEANFTEDSGVCSLEELFKANFTEDSCLLENFLAVNFTEDDGVCSLEDVLSTISISETNCETTIEDIKFSEDSCAAGDICENINVTSTNCSGDVCSGNVFTEDFCTAGNECSSMNYSESSCEVAGSCTNYNYSEDSCPVGNECSSMNYSETSCEVTGSCRDYNYSEDSCPVGNECSSMNYSETSCEVTGSCRNYNYSENFCSSGDSCSSSNYSETSCEASDSCDKNHYTEFFCEFGDACSLYIFTELEEECSPGYSLNPDLHSCEPCPIGYYGLGGTSKCMPCSTCGKNAVQNGSCSGGSTADVNCTCKPGFSGDGKKCTSLVLPDPILISVSPSAGHCVKQNQLITVNVTNFPAFDRNFVSVTMTLAGKAYKRLEWNVSWNLIISGNLDHSSATFTLNPEAPANKDRGIATFVLTVNMGSNSKEIKFGFEYKPYFIGAPTDVIYSPPFVFQGQTCTAFVSFSNFKPIKAVSNGNVSAWGYNFRMNLTKVEILKSTVEETKLRIDLGKMHTIGNFFLKICTVDSESGYYCADTGNISVKEPPDPKILSPTVFPRSVSAGKSDQSVTLQVTAQYLSPSANRSHLHAKLIRPETPLKILAVRSLAPTCQEAFCALDQISVELPSNGNPDGEKVSGRYSIEVALPTVSMGQFTFSYVSMTDPEIAFVSRKSLILPVNSNTGFVRVKLLNFPSPSCDKICYDSLSQTTTVEFGAIESTIMVRSKPLEALELDLVVPAYGKAEIVPVVIKTTSNRMAINVSFDFEFVAPPATVNPIDGVTLGGTTVTITAIGWGDASNSLSASNLSRIYAQFGEQRVTALSILEANANRSYSAVTAVFRTPSKVDNSTGSVESKIGLSDSNTTLSSFQWQYFAKPEISKVNPDNATVGGFTGTADGNTIILSIQGFPRVSLLSSLQ